MVFNIINIYIIVPKNQNLNKSIIIEKIGVWMLAVGESLCIMIEK